LKDIAAAGYSTVQTSPINRCYDKDQGPQLYGNGKWYYHYQPTEWTIGNYQLGTRDEYKALCAEAEKYGIKIISDVLPNHTTPTTSNIKGQLKTLMDQGKLYHANGRNSIDYSSRWSIITGKMGGLPDVNTEGYDFQKYYMEFVNDVIDCGGDGFRYDTAKHIGTPIDPTDDADHPNGNNFWPLVTGKQSYSGIPSLKNRSSLYIYGEILQGGDSEGTPYSEYAKYLDGMTASNYGIKHSSGDDMGTLGWALKNKDFSTSTVLSFNHPLAGNRGGDGSKLVTWVESHDTYCNDHNSADFSDWRIRMGWAIIAARSEGTPLFFNRPANSSSSNVWGDNLIGKAGNDEWKSKEVAAVNRFRNAMIGEKDYMRNPNNNKQILQIDRGKKGTCIINLGSSTSINNTTTMADGQYKDQVSGRTFTVSGGRISGKLDGGKIAVIYNAQPIEDYGISVSPESGTYTTDTQSVTLTATNMSSASYRIDSGSWTSFTDIKTITVGSASDAHGTVHTVDVKGTATNGDSVSATYTYTKQDLNQRFSSGKQIYCVKPSGWKNTIYCYAYTGKNTKNAAWPGVKMTNEGDGIYSYDLPSGWTDAYVIFNDGNNQDPASQQPGFQYTSGKTMAYENGSFTEVQVDVPVTSVTMSPTSLNLKVGETGSLTATVAPSNASDKTLTWKSSDTSVATVSNGTVTAKAVGTATITATSNNGKSATATVTVSKDDVAVTSVSVSPTSLNLTVGDTGELTATVSPSNATDKTLTWISSNTSVATVSDGAVTAKAAGTATITATSNNGKVATATVNVTSPVNTLKVSDFSTNKGTSAVVGTQVMLMASAEGGSGSYQYAFKVQSASNQWFTIQNTSSKNTATWKASVAGQKTLYAYVKDSTGKVVSKTLSFNVTDSTSNLAVASFTASTGTSAKSGTKVTLSTTAKGGTGFYQYAFKVKSANGTWYTIQDTSTQSRATWTTGSTGTKTLYAYVKDSNGKVAQKTLTFTVN